MFRPWFGQYGLARKVTGTVVLVAFFVTNVLTDAWSAIEQPAQIPYAITTDDAHNISYSLLDASTITIPEHLGEVQFGYKGSSDKFVVHIQDAHCNVYAQHKIADIIDYISKEYGVRLVNLEGGVGEYDLTPFTSITGTEIRREVADYFVKQGDISGAEFYAANNPDKVRLWGVENKELYLANLEVYRDSLSYKADVDRYISELSRAVNNLKVYLFSKELISLDISYAAYKSGNMDFGKYLRYLVDKGRVTGVGLNGFRNLSLLSSALEKEDDIDFERANVERTALVEELKERLSRNESRELVSKSVAFKTKRLSLRAFYGYLFDKVREVGLDPGRFPELSKYIGYVTVYESVDRTRVMEELDKYEDAVREPLYTSAEQRTLNRLSRNLSIMRNMFDIKLIKTDYYYYRGNRETFSVKAYTDFLLPASKEHGITLEISDDCANLNKYLGDISAFYAYSFKRDEAFLDNIRFEEVRGPAEAAMLMTGGFHTENICELFRKKGISYVSILPKFTVKDDFKDPYYEILAGQTTDLQRMLSSVIAKASMMAVASKLNPILAEAVCGQEEIDAFRAAVRVLAELGRENGNIKNVINAIGEDARNLSVVYDSTSGTLNCALMRNGKEIGRPVSIPVSELVAEARKERREALPGPPLGPQAELVDASASPGVSGDAGTEAGTTGGTGQENMPARVSDAHKKAVMAFIVVSVILISGFTPVHAMVVVGTLLGYHVLRHFTLKLLSSRAVSAIRGVDYRGKLDRLFALSRTKPGLCVSLTIGMGLISLLLYALSPAGKAPVPGEGDGTAGLQRQSTSMSFSGVSGADIGYTERMKAEAGAIASHYESIKEALTPDQRRMIEGVIVVLRTKELRFSADKNYAHADTEKGFIALPVSNFASDDMLRSGLIHEALHFYYRESGMSLDEEVKISGFENDADYWLWLSPGEEGWVLRNTPVVEGILNSYKRGDDGRILKMRYEMYEEQPSGYAEKIMVYDSKPVSVSDMLDLARDDTMVKEKRDFVIRALALAALDKLRGAGIGEPVSPEDRELAAKGVKDLAEHYRARTAYYFDLIRNEDPFFAPDDMDAVREAFGQYRDDTSRLTARQALIIRWWSNYELQRTSAQAVEMLLLNMPAMPDEGVRTDFGIPGLLNNILILTLFFIPAIAIHEVGHFIAGKIFGAKPKFVMSWETARGKRIFPTFAVRHMNFEQGAKGAVIYASGPIAELIYGAGLMMISPLLVASPAGAYITFMAGVMTALHATLGNWSDLAGLKDSMFPGTGERSGTGTTEPGVMDYLLTRGNPSGEARKALDILRKRSDAASGINKVVLEIGCGTATFADQLVRANPDMAVIATDIYDTENKVPLYGGWARDWERGRLRAQRRNDPRLAILRADMDILRAMPDGSLDSILLMNPAGPDITNDLVNMLQNEGLLNKLRPDGTIVIKPVAGFNQTLLMDNRVFAKSDLELWGVGVTDQLNIVEDSAKGEKGNLWVWSRNNPEEPLPFAEDAEVLEALGSEFEVPERRLIGDFDALRRNVSDKFEEYKAKFPQHVSKLEEIRNALLDNLRYITFEEFRDKVRSMAEAINRELEGYDKGAWGVILGKTSNKSKMYVYQMARETLRADIGEPVEIYSNHDENGARSGWLARLDGIPDGGKVVIFDDSSFSGWDADEMIAMIDAARPDIEVILAIPYVATFALNIFLGMDMDEDVKMNLLRDNAGNLLTENMVTINDILPELDEREREDLSSDPWLDEIYVGSPWRMLTVFDNRDPDRHSFPEGLRMMMGFEYAAAPYKEGANAAYTEWERAKFTSLTGITPEQAAAAMRSTIYREEQEEDAGEVFATLEEYVEYARDKFREELQGIKGQFRDAALSGKEFDFGSAYSDLIDDTIIRLAEFMGIADKVTLIGMGSYARRAAPYGTDLDLFILIKDRDDIVTLRRQAAEFGMLAGEITGVTLDYPAYPEVGADHNIKALTMDEFQKDYLDYFEERDIAGMRSIMDWRYISGPVSVEDIRKGFEEAIRDAETFKHLMSRYVLRQDFKAIVEGKDEMDMADPMRSITYINPGNYHTKKGRGGLRTIDLITWMGRTVAGMPTWDWARPDAFRENAMTLTRGEQVLGETEVEALSQARKFLVALRTAVNIVWDDSGLMDADRQDMLKKEIWTDVAVLMGMGELADPEEILTAELKRHIGNVAAIFNSFMDADYRGLLLEREYPPLEADELDMDSLIPARGPVTAPVAIGEDSGLALEEAEEDHIVASPEKKMTAAAVMMGDMVPDTADWIITPGPSDVGAMSDKVSLESELKQLLRKSSEYRMDTILRGYNTGAADAEAEFRDVFSRVIGEMGDDHYKDKTPKAIVFVSRDMREMALKVLRELMPDPEKSFAVVSEDSLPPGGMIDLVNHVMLGKGLLNYKRIAERQAAAAEAPSEVRQEVRSNIIRYLKMMISIPDIIDENDPDVIEKILDGSISLPIMTPVVNTWKEDQQKLLMFLRSA
ncbi:MAG: hypothetical protein PHH49_00815 [Candidatus Omnitrophica bacterium]|nr:hypothetical protein [Candidatus Omnitrophota bacterium]MDD5487493.1 hypothetical protein [Candidatus Omnitrophota bacterium]